MATEIKPNTGTWAVKSGLAQMLKGGVIMDVVNAEQAVIAEKSGAVATGVVICQRVRARCQDHRSPRSAG